MKEVTFITGNIGKWEIAKDIFSAYDIELLQQKLLKLCLYIASIIWSLKE